MARNEEKSQSMLNRYLQMKNEETSTPREKRPPLASMEHSLVKAEKWRMQLLREIGRHVSDIQNGMSRSDIDETRKPAASTIDRTTSPTSFHNEGDENHDD
jgi:hypothetical protein